MAKSEHLWRLASRMLLVAKRTKDPAIAESLSMQAGDLLAQAQDVEADAPLFPRDAIIRIKKRSVGDHDARRYGICGSGDVFQYCGRFTNSGSFAIFIAIRRASSLVRSLAEKLFRSDVRYHR